jgi:hypothetical protein
MRSVLEMDRTHLAYQAIRDVFAVEVLELSDEIGRLTATWSRSRCSNTV